VAISTLLRCHGQEKCPNKKKPPGSGSWYYNYMGMFSIVLLAIVNANYEIILAVRTNRRISDGGVIRNIKVYELLNKNALKVPLSSQLPNSDKTTPYIFVGDAFQ
jgi:hypothetical protein